MVITISISKFIPYY